MTSSRAQTILRNIRAMSDGMAVMSGLSRHMVHVADTGASLDELAQLVNAGDVEQRGEYVRAVAK